MISSPSLKSSISPAQRNPLPTFFVPAVTLTLFHFGFLKKKDIDIYE